MVLREGDRLGVGAARVEPAIDVAREGADRGALFGASETLEPVVVKRGQRGRDMHQFDQAIGADAGGGARDPSRLGGKLGAGHFHNTRGQGLANAVAALEAGVTTLDASLGGLGGCPYAPGATGNIVTEDLVFLLESMGLRTGIDLAKLVAARAIVAEALPGEPLYGHLADAGLPKGFAYAASSRS